ncbi:Retrotransposable element Tf2 protein [Rhizoctonia solani]|uniref:Retrotransposable element Tf2 protein n=1 Tax=Rhizoctonia solani TaxID=456999 RepID=A0A8H8SY93_9AGAM|nr:Retrotransposable element Tf2 protein [Rhizoctonia solani]QRW22961.1 Retrotransposable element Tf2 protein [Rhizoctonia solani]
MATRSRTTSQTQSPFDQGYVEPQLPPATSVEYGKVSLERVTQLLLGLLSQVKRLEQEIAKIKEAGVETRTNVKNISQTVDVVKDGLRTLQLQGPRTPEGPQPKAMEETPRPIPKVEPTGTTSRVPFWEEAPRAIPGLAQPTPRRIAPPRVLSPPLSPHLQSPIGASAPPPPAPIAAYPAPVKVDHPDAYTGKIGSEAKQWLTRMLAWTRLNSCMFPTDQEVLSFLLMNMKDSAGAWAHPHLDQLGSHQAIIQTVEGFKSEFLAAFGNPDATRAAERKITTLTQSGTCADYITKFRTLAMELDWNNAALRGQFARGLHWENAALVIDNALRKERASHPPRDNKPSRPSNPTRGTSTGQVTSGSKKLSNDPNFVSEEEQNRRCAAGACIKCGKMGHKFAECCTGWKATPVEDKGKAKETAKIGKDSKYQLGKDNNRISPLFTISIKPEKQAEHLEVLIDSGATSLFLHPCTAESLCLPLIDLPSPRTVTMLDGLSPQARKIWKKANLTFSLDGKKMTKTFLICNTGSHAAILGLKWLDAHNPEIDWNAQTLSFPHTPPEHVAIAKEEEADQKPLEGVPLEYHQYAKVFGEEEFNKLPPHRHYNIGIELTEEGPLNLPLYSMTDAESATLKDWLRDELKMGKIRPSKSSISSLVMFVPKKDGSRCLVVDYRRLNNRTKKNVYPLPRPDNLMAQLRGTKVFTKLDLRWGYNNIRVKEGDKWKTVFRTKYGLYESLVMTFGLTNAPASFQHFMNDLFKDLLDVCVIIYLDDILIYSKDDATHTQHVHKVLHRLMENQLFCKASKCTFHVTSVEYLGIIVLDKGFSLDKLKIQAVQEWPTPTRVKEVQLFLGFANFLRRFVANFSHMARPLHNLVKKDTPWKWDTKEQEAFQGLKDAITNAPVLCHADPSKPYFLETDASGAALGSILSQQQGDGRLHPLGFLSESFKGAEQNYNTHDKELLAIIRSFEYWRIFLEGTLHPVTVFTDHRNLEYWKESRTFNRRHARWHLLLAGYNFQIVYCPGKQSGKPDALSRRLDHADIPPANQTMLPNPVFANVALVIPKKELQRQIKASLDQDESLEEILQFLQNESKAPPSIKKAFKDYKMEAGLLFYQGRIVVPDVGTLRTELLCIFHDSPLAGHPGRQQTLELICRNYYWPGICADTYWHVDSCKTCQRICKPKYASIPPQPLELPSRPWQHISYDMIVDLPKDGNFNSILVIVNSFTKYGIFIKYSKKLKAPELADLFLENVWKRHGMPEKTISDRGRVFNNKFLQALYKRLGIDPHYSSAYHPQSDGQTEQVNPSIEHFLRAYSGINQRDWTKWLPMAEFAYNNAVHSSTEKTPFKALYGWEPTLTPLNVPTDVPEADNLAQAMEAQWKEVESALQQSKQRMVAGEDRNPVEFKIGEEAWLDAKNINLKTLSPKLTKQRLGPFKVIEKISDHAYQLELPPTMRIHNVFYVGLLSKVKKDKKRTFENCPPPVTIDGEEEYEVEGITDAEERNGEWFFRVKWKGYGKILEKYKKDMKKKVLSAAKALRGGADTLLELQNAALVINNALCKERTSHPPRDNKPSKETNPARGTSTGQTTARSRKLSNNPNFVLEEERNCCRTAGACIKCSKMGHKFAECCTGWKATPVEDKGKAKETAKDPKDSGLMLEICNISVSKNAPLFTISIQPEKKAEKLEALIDSGATSLFLHPCTAKTLCLPLIDLPQPCTVTMLNGSSPQARKSWKKAQLTFLLDGKHMTETFLICNTGSHTAILGIKWLEHHNLEIDWNSQTLSFPHAPLEHMAIAEEEEADKNPLEGVPSKYHQYAKVFGEEEFNKLPPIGITTVG